MGEVYLARDTSVGRDVAIKLLPEDLAADQDRLQRFRREARLLASLSHPNIAGLYALEEEDDVPFLVMERVEGETLATRLRRGRVPLRTGLEIAIQIAEALAVVHERGVVHRDLKPSNVMLTPQGVVKLIDFGVARRDSIDSRADTQSHDFAATRGQVVGTPAYMSPEYIEGSPADEQADIWAFGCVLHELVTGKHPFPAPGRSDQITAILEREPDWSGLSGLPTKLRDLVKRCLRKEPARRLHDISDARIEIEEILAENESGPPAGTRAGPWISWRSGVAAAGALVVVLFTLLRRPSNDPTVLSPEPVRRFALDLRNKLAFGGDYPAAIALSPKGDLVAYVVDSPSGRTINIRAMDEIEARALDGTAGAQQPFFSPDGRWLAFFADGKLKKISVRGGAPIALATAPNGQGGVWSRDGWIVFAPSDFSGLQRVADSGGQPGPFTRLDPGAVEQAHRYPVLLPDQRTVLFTVFSGGRSAESRVAMQGTGQADHKIVLTGGSHGRFLAPRWLIYARGSELLAVSFDASAGSVTGTPFRVLDGVQETPGTGAPLFSISDQGTLVYAPAVTTARAGRMVWVDRAGHVQEEVESGNSYYRPRLSPDGSRIAFHFPGPDLDVWVKDLARGTRSNLTRHVGWDAFAVWSPDSAQIAFSSARDGPRTLFVQAADGSAPAERLLSMANPRWPTSWSADGEWLAYFEEDAETALDVWLLNMRTRQPRPLFQTNSREAWARFSPDGQWLAYHSDESGAFEVYVCALQRPSRRWQVSTGGGMVPIWSPAGDQIYYNRGTQFMAAPIRLGPSPVIARPQTLFAVDALEINDTSVRGDAFIAADAPVAVSINRLAVVLGWPRVLAQLAETTEPR